MNNILRKDFLEHTKIGLIYAEESSFGEAGYIASELERIDNVYKDFILEKTKENA